MSMHFRMPLAFFMPAKTHSSQIAIAPGAKLFVLGSRLKNSAVIAAFRDILLAQSGKKSGAPEIRKEIPGNPKTTRFSWLCFCIEPPVSFLRNTTLTEKRYGFVLLIEHRKLLGIFTRGVSGVEDYFKDDVTALPRDTLMHLWGDLARYEKVSARRMTLGNTELLGVRYEARDLQTSMPPAGAGRSIPTSFQLAIDGEGNRAITPNTGRIQKTGDRGDLTELVNFIDEVADEMAANHSSPFMGSFSVPVDLAQMPSSVRPTGVLLDWPELDDLLADKAKWELKHAVEGVSALNKRLGDVFKVVVDGAQGDRWMSRHGADELLQIKKLTHTFGLTVKTVDGWTLRNLATNQETPLGKWFYQNDAFRIAFSNPEYFYTAGSLYRRASFQEDAKQVLRFLETQTFLGGVTSEKGDLNAYTQQSLNFDADSIFRRLELHSGPAYPHFICTDLNDEWADYIGIGGNEVIFFHCKHKEITAGASAFQEVIAQGLKNLGRIKFTPAEITKKLDDYRQKPLWVSTKGIPRLVTGDWQPAIATSALAIADPNTTWKVVLVVTALSKAEFEIERQKIQLEPHFIQLVWLLSAFISMCREKDARPAIWCLP